MRDFKSERYKKWRSKVYNRDGYKCRKCEAKKNLEAHHVNDWSGNEDDRFMVSNGVTLCVPCHTKFHKKYGKGGNNKKQLEEYLQEKLKIKKMEPLF